MARLQISMQLPAPGAADVGSREFHCAVDGVNADPQTLAGDAGTALFVCQAGQTFECWLVDIDTSGNRSPESPHFGPEIAKDTFAPPAPGALGVMNVVDLDVSAGSGSGNSGTGSGSGSGSGSAPVGQGSGQGSGSGSSSGSGSGSA